MRKVRRTRNTQVGSACAQQSAICSLGNMNRRRAINSVRFTCLCTTGAGQAGESQAWAQAMNTIVSNGTGSGAVLFQSFPQEIVDAFAGAPAASGVRVSIAKDHQRYRLVDDQQRAFLVERDRQSDGPEGVKRVFLFQYKGSGT